MTDNSPAKWCSKRIYELNNFNDAANLSHKNIILIDTFHLQVEQLNTYICWFHRRNVFILLHQLQHTKPSLNETRIESFRWWWNSKKKNEDGKRAIAAWNSVCQIFANYHLSILRAFGKDFVERTNTKLQQPLILKVKV